MRNLLHIALVLSLCTSCQPASSQMTTRVVADNLFMPWEMIYGPDNHIWFTQKNGYICRLEPDSGHIDTLYHETNTSVSGEGGMLGMVLHPDFTNSPYIYVAYNYNQGGYKERVARYTYNGTALTNPMTIIENIPAASIHNGCRMLIVNNQLYITTGDAADQPSAQNINSLSGKILRLNLDGSVPNDNPIPGNPVWSWGHRNAQGLVYANGRFYSSEHGPNANDELNILQQGRNFGWPTVQGFCDLPGETAFCTDSNVVEPIKAWTPTIAVGDIDYYNHPMFPALQNSILMVTLKDMKLHQLALNSTFDQVTTSTTLSQISGSRLRAICIDPDGRIYISTSMSSSSGSGSKIDKIIEIYDPSYSSVAQMLKEKKQTIAVYPNPAKDEINVYANISVGNNTFNYSIINSAGQVVGRNTLQAGSNKIAITQLSSGIYWLKITDGGGEVNSTKFNKL